MTETEVGRLLALDDAKMEPLGAVQARLLNDQAAGKNHDPLGLGRHKDFLCRPFQFYGGFVTLSADQRLQLRENELATYYKVSCDDLLEAHKHLLVEMDVLSADALEARNEKFAADAEVRRLNEVIKKQEKAMEKLEAANTTTIKKIVLKNNKKMMITVEDHNKELRLPQ